ncbi:MAG: hypothetical protein FWE16_02600 [Firmicutes bacterium]|nr:hypothetical protein [Bacillota bacterium]
MNKESLTFDEVQSVVQNAVSWWVQKLSAGQNVSQEQLKNFQTILSGEVQIELARTGHVTLQTDYYPEELLAKVAHLTHIRGSEFPQKTFMDITPREVGIRQNCPHRELLFYIQKKTKLASDTGEAQREIDLLSKT